MQKVRRAYKKDCLLSTEERNLPFEKWKDISGFEDMYQLSNYGRVRSLDRWVETKNDTTYFIKGQIIKLRAPVKNGADLNIQVKLHKDGNRYVYSIPRLVYNYFVKPFDMNDHTRIIRRKDGNLANCYFKNLFLISISEVAKQGFAEKIRHSIFSEQIKPVSQYSLSGDFLKTYLCAKDASTETGIAQNYISDAARVKARPAGMYYWRYGKPKAKINVQKLKARLKCYQRLLPRKVKQFTKNGVYLKTYRTVGEAAKAVGMVSGSGISFVCQGRQKTCKGYKWKYAKAQPFEHFPVSKQL